MRLLSEPAIAAPVSCPYLKNRRFIQEFFFASDVDRYEMQAIISSGWRRFGQFFFRPRCHHCRRCIPIRVDALNLSPSSSQRRILRRTANVQMEAVEPNLTDEVWDTYEQHSRSRFGGDPDRGEFEKSYYASAGEMLQTEYRIDGKLVGVGFLDVTADGMSSIYFSFLPSQSRYSLGNLSVFREAELVRSRGLRWYYLGYWVAGSATMDYKKHFAPHQMFDWRRKSWVDSEDLELKFGA